MKVGEQHETREVDEAYTLLTAIINNIHPISEAAWSDFKLLMSFRKPGKGDLLFKEGDYPNVAVFLVSGSVKAYHILPDGRKHIKNFFISQSFPFPLSAIITGGANRFNFEALEDCRILQFNYLSFTELFAKYRCLETLTRKLIELKYIEKEGREISLVLKDATQRYLQFQRDFPRLESIIPQHYISSYLGITPVQLSRIRKRLTATGTNLIT